MKIHFRKKTISLSAKKVSPFGKFSGLMFRSSKTKNLLFEFNSWEEKAIHSFFVFFPFLAVWLDEKNNVLDFQRIRPFTLIAKSKKNPAKLVELPLNEKNARSIRLLVGKGNI